MSPNLHCWDTRQIFFKCTAFTILASSPGCVKRGYEQLMLNVLPLGLAFSLSPIGKGRKMTFLPLCKTFSMYITCYNVFPRLRPKCPHLVLIWITVSKGYLPPTENSVLCNIMSIYFVENLLSALLGRDWNRDVCSNTKSLSHLRRLQCLPFYASVNFEKLILQVWVIFIQFFPSISWVFKTLDVFFFISYT